MFGSTTNRVGARSRRGCEVTRVDPGSDGYRSPTISGELCFHNALRQSGSLLHGFTSMCGRTEGNFSTLPWVGLAGVVRGQWRCVTGIGNASGWMRTTVCFQSYLSEKTSGKLCPGSTDRGGSTKKNFAMWFSYM